MTNYKRSLKIIFIFCLLFQICNLLLPTTAKAQSALGLSAIPPRLEIIVNPGQVKTAQLKVRNESSTPKILTTTVHDFIVTDNAGTPIQLEDITESENRWAAGSWIQVSPTVSKIKAGETKNLTITILAPTNATPGGHYAMVLHTPETTAVLDSSGAAIQTNVGTLVYITIPGDITQNAQVKKFTAPKFSEFGPINLETIITNLSDIHISPIGAISITNWFGQKTATLPLEKINIFPYTSRTFQNILNRKWLFGRYQAQLNAAYGTSGQALRATTFFWVIPWRLIVLSLAAITITMILIKLIKNKRNKQNETKKQ